MIIIRVALNLTPSTASAFEFAARSLVPTLFCSLADGVVPCCAFFPFGAPCSRASRWRTSPRRPISAPRSPTTVRSFLACSLSEATACWCACRHTPDCCPLLCTPIPSAGVRLAPESDYVSCLVGLPLMQTSRWTCTRVCSRWRTPWPSIPCSSFWTMVRPLSSSAILVVLS